MDLQALLERAIDHEQQGRLDEAVSAYVALVRDGWDHAAQFDPFERLLQIHLHRREIDAAWCAASILEGLGRLEGTERELYEDYVPRRLPARRGRLDAAAWELLRDPDEDLRLSATLGAIAKKLAPPMDSRGIDPAVLAWAADALGAPAGAVELVEPALEPHTDLDEVRAGYMLRERLFFAGREATALVAPHYALARCDLRKIKAALGDSAVGDIEAWHRSIQRTRLRAGLLVCGEPWVARGMLRGEGVTDDDPRYVSPHADLAAFAVSPEHHRLRALIGVAVGMGADAVAAPAPAPPDPKPATPAFSDTIERTCASCEKAGHYPTKELFRRAPQVNEEASGLDGRPGYSDDLAWSATLLDRELFLTECPNCGHVAQVIDVALPRLDVAREARASILALEAHDPRARRYLYIAQLYGDADLREQGLWVLRAAWANEAEGRVEIARRLRRRAGALLDDSVQEGYALEPVRGGTSLALAEIFRVAGDFERAAEHCHRGFRLRSSDAKRLMVAVATRVLERRSEPLTRARAREEFAAFSTEQLTALGLKIQAACPTIPPLRIRPSRRFFSTKLFTSQSARDAEAITFAVDFLDADLLPELLRVGRYGVWAGVVAHPELFPVLLRATNHADADVRSSAVDALYNKTFNKEESKGDGFEPDALKGHEDAIDAVVARLSDDDDATVRKAGAILRQLIFLDRSCAPRIAAGARRALPKWTKDLSTTGVLERLVELAPPPVLIETGSEASSAHMSPLLRLSRVLEERGVPLMPLLRAVELSGRPIATLAVSALYPRVYLLVPYSSDVLEAVAPGASVGDLPARPMLKVYLDGDRIDVSLVSVGMAPPSEAVAVAPPGSRAAWLDIVTTMPALATGRVTSRMRYLTQERATIGMFYDRRAPEVDGQLFVGIERIASRLGVPLEHRVLWGTAHRTMGGSPVTVTTACTANGPAPELTFLYREADWDQAVDLCKLVASPEAARGGAAVLGSIAGTLQLEKTEGVELVFSSGAPDVVVWLLPRVRY